MTREYAISKAKDKDVKNVKQVLLLLKNSYSKNKNINPKIKEFVDILLKEIENSNYIDESRYYWQRVDVLLNWDEEVPFDNLQQPYNTILIFGSIGIACLTLILVFLWVPVPQTKLPKQDIVHLGDGTYEFNNVKCDSLFDGVRSDRIVNLAIFLCVKGNRGLCIPSNLREATGYRVKLKIGQINNGIIRKFDIKWINEQKKRGLPLQFVITFLAGLPERSKDYKIIDMPPN